MVDGNLIDPKQNRKVEDIYYLLMQVKEKEPYIPQWLTQTYGLISSKSIEV